MTIRHIVGVPNHIRACTRTAYRGAGGYSRLHVANDYELLVRSFPTTRFVHIPRHYEQRIHARLLELGVDDFIWTPNGLDYTRPRPEPESHCSMVLQS